MSQPGSSARNRWSICLRSLRLSFCPRRSRSQVDSFRLAMANSTSTVGLARLGSVGNTYTNSPTGSSLAFSRLPLATTQLIATTEVILCDGHLGTMKQSTIACRAGRPNYAAAAHPKFPTSIDPGTAGSRALWVVETAQTSYRAIGGRQVKAHGSAARVTTNLLR